MHQDLYDRIKPAAAEVDTGVAQLLVDLKQRGLLKKSLVVCLGEFGRTPKINSRGKNPGRDHWARNFGILRAAASRGASRSARPSPMVWRLSIGP